MAKGLLQRFFYFADGLLTRTKERRYNEQIEAYLPRAGGGIEC